MYTGVYEGPQATRDYLNPANYPFLPLVEVPASVNPFASEGVRIFAKIMGVLPLANVKSMPAYSMLESAERDGTLKGVKTLVEASSGNTVFSEAAIGRAFGINRTIAYASHEVERGKLLLLRLFGTFVRIVAEDICPDPSDPESAINKARRLGKQEGYFNPGQFENEANPAAHTRWTGPQLWIQREDMTVFCAGLGTTGTLTGTARYLKEQNPSVRCIGIVRAPNNPVPGVRTQNLLGEINFPWKDFVDDLIEVGTKDAYLQSALLCPEGLAVGPSSGFAYAGLLKYLEQVKEKGKLDELRNKSGEVVAVFICPDTPFPYLDEYPRYLGDDFFPPIEGEGLLRHGSGQSVATSLQDTECEIEPDALYAEAYREDQNTLWQKIQSQYDATRDSVLGSRVTLVDTRSRQEFDDHHVPGSLPIDLEQLTTTEVSWQIFMRTFLRSKDKVIFVCRAGFISKHLALKARDSGVDAWSLKGGTIEWCRLGLPRAKGCKPSTRGEK